MMKKDDAIGIQSRALSAIRELNSIAQLPLDWEAEEELREVKRGISLAIGQIDFEILTRMYRRFPDLDDLRDMDLSQFDELLRKK